MNPEQRKKLDGWILGLQLAIGGIEKWRGIVGFNGDFGLPDLLKVIELFRNGDHVGAIELLGLGKPRGGQIDHENALIWMILMSWIDAARSHKAVMGKRTISDFLFYLQHAGEKDWIRSKEAELSTFEKYRKKFKIENGSGACFKLKVGLAGSIAPEVVNYLERQSKLRLWRTLPFNGLPVDLFQWSFESPGLGWYEASLNWTECG